MVMKYNSEMIPVFINGEYWLNTNLIEDYITLNIMSEELTKPSETCHAGYRIPRRMKQVTLRLMDDPILYAYLNDDDVYIDSGRIWLK
jgi:hypothetical protein